MLASKNFLSESEQSVPWLIIFSYGGSDGKASACHAGDPGLISGWRSSPVEGNGSPLEYSCLENIMDGGVWQAAIGGVTESDTTEQLSHHVNFVS